MSEIVEITSQAECNQAAQHQIDHGNTRDGRDSLALAAMKGGFLLPLNFADSVHKARQTREYATFSGEYPLDREEAIRLASTPAGKATLAGRGLMGGFIAAPSAQATREEADRLLGMTHAGQKAIEQRRANEAGKAASSAGPEPDRAESDRLLELSEAGRQALRRREEAAAGKAS